MSDDDEPAGVIVWLTRPPQTARFYPDILHRDR